MKLFQDETLYYTPERDDYRHVRGSFGHEDVADKRQKRTENVVKIDSFKHGVYSNSIHS